MLAGTEGKREKRKTGKRAIATGVSTSAWCHRSPRGLGKLATDGEVAKLGSADGPPRAPSAQVLCPGCMYYIHSGGVSFFPSFGGGRMGRLGRKLLVTETFPRSRAMNVREGVCELRTPKRNSVSGFVGAGSPIFCCVLSGLGGAERGWALGRERWANSSDGAPRDGSTNQPGFDHRLF